jgi:dimethylglycine dehydrogenase
VREERGGWILGPYERNAPARFLYDVPESFRADLFPLDLERIEEEYMSMIHRIPSSEDVGLKDDYNGPICYTPDGNPLVGPRRGCATCGWPRGFQLRHHRRRRHRALPRADDDRGRGRDRHGGLDPRRYGDWMTTEYAARKNEECYEHVYHPAPPRRGARSLPPAAHRALPMTGRRRAARSSGR